MRSWYRIGAQKNIKRCVNIVLLHYSFLTYLHIATFMQPTRNHNHRGQDERTRDLRAMFTKATRTNDQKTENGHICNVCTLALISFQFGDH